MKRMILISIIGLCAGCYDPSDCDITGHRWGKWTFEHVAITVNGDSKTHQRQRTNPEGVVEWSRVRRCGTCSDLERKWF